MHSSFVFFSLGVAGEHKPINTRFLNVVPHEIFPVMDGEVGYNPTQIKTSYKKKDETQVELSTYTDSTISCEWFPAGTNRVTPPDIRRGEYVEIWRMADTDQYYWRATGISDALRKQETVIYAFGASQNESGCGQKLDQCYYVEVSGHLGHITIQTSKANGEPFAWTAQINAKEGALNILADVGIGLEIDAKNDLLRAYNASGSFLKLDKKKISANADTELSLTVGRNKLVMSPGGTYWNGSPWTYR